jgi:hypothetical protein
VREEKVVLPYEIENSLFCNCSVKINEKKENKCPIMSCRATIRINPEKAVLQKNTVSCTLLKIQFVEDDTSIQLGL